MTAAGRGAVVADATGDTGELAALLCRSLAGGGVRVVHLAGPKAAPAPDATHVVAVQPGDEDSIEQAFDDALEVIDGLGWLAVTVALGHETGLAATSAEEWEGALGAGLRTPFLVLRRGLHEMLAGGAGGRILLVVAGPAGSRAVAGALRAGLVCLARSVAIEYGRRGIACNALLLPGAATPPSASALETARFLLSRDASFVNGEIIDLEAGSDACDAHGG